MKNRKSHSYLSVVSVVALVAALLNAGLVTQDCSYR
jgi:hypothetical protein